MTSFWGLINLLEWLIELRKTNLPTRLPVYYKRILEDLNQQPHEEIYRAMSYSTSSPSPLPWKLGGETKFQPSNHIIGNQRLPWVGSKVTSLQELRIRIFFKNWGQESKYYLTALISGNSKCLGSCYLGIVAEGQTQITKHMHFSYKLQYCRWDAENKKIIFIYYNNTIIISCALTWGPVSVLHTRF